MTTIICSRCKATIWPKIGVYGGGCELNVNGEFICDECSRPSAGLNILRDEIKANNIIRGWYDGEMPRPLEMHALMHSEISEATESVRNGEDAVWISNEDPGGLDYKPEGEAIELMDCLIRILDRFGREGWNADAIYRQKMDYNKARPYRHGGKKI